MKPIRATYNYQIRVPVDFDNPLHEKYVGLDYAIEDAKMSGFITDVMKLNDFVEGDKKNLDGVYVIFWADKGEHYQLMVEDFSKFTVSDKEMRNYVAAYNV